MSEQTASVAPASPGSPTWYDVLDVETDASTEQIRAAWRDAIADLGPTDRRFRLLNQAAETLLDPELRAAYDAELPPAEPEPEPAVQPEPGPAAEPEPAAVTITKPDPAVVTAPRRGPSAWLLTPVAIVTALLIAAAAYLFTQPSDDSIAASTDDAQSAAEQAATTILAYDYRRMAADQKAADALMTPSYADKYNALFAQLEANAPTVKPVVTATVLASGIVRSGADRVQVLVFVNQDSTRADGQARVDHNQARFTMVRSGDTWLVDDIATS